MSEFLNLNNLTKIKEVGHGAFGVVYKVSENRTNKIFAAKISFAELNKDDLTQITDLKREVNILSQLKYPSVLRFIGYSPFDFNNNSHPVIVTEYSSNGSLDDIIKLDRKHLASETWTDTKKLINIYGIAAAMKYLHSHNIIHRDLKPANILEDENFFPKIADFGLSKTYNKKSDNNESKSASYPKGTPIYIAPEIWRNNEYSKAGDVYAFAIIVYEILTLDEPFKNYNCYSLMLRVALNGERPEIRYPLPDCYENLIEKCWSANPEERPTFNEIVKKLRKNKRFIIDTIDKKEYFDYIDSIDYSENSFDPNKKLKSLLFTKKIDEDDRSEKKSDDLPKKISEEVSDESLETNVEQMITVKTFNDLTLKSQQLTISNIIKIDSDNNNEVLFNLNKILNYLNEICSTSSSSLEEEDKNYICIITKEEEITIDEILQVNPKISISHKTIDKFIEQDLSKFTEFLNMITTFERVIIEIKYPIPIFDKLYEQILTYKSKYSEKIRINIFISGIIKTDMRFRNDVNIDSVLFDNDVSQITGELFKKEKNGEKRGGGSFFVCSSLRKISLSSSISVIGEYAFTNCLLLTQIKIPASVTKIGNHSFHDCKSLTQVEFEIPSSVTEIGENAFYKCSSLTQISLPTLITEIKSQVFMKCLSLTRIEIPSSVTSIENYAFYRCSLLRIILIPSSLTEIGEYAFSKCSSLTQITFENPSSLTEIGEYAFSKCSSLTQITIPSSVTKIGKYAYFGCSSLTQILFENSSSLTEIEEYAFSKCSSLTQVTIPSSVIKIGESAFQGCLSLTQFIIPSSVTKIEMSSFSECSSLSHITIPSSITEIGEYAFLGCSSLTQIIIPSSVTKILNDTFSECSSLTQITIPSSVTKIWRRTFSGCSSLTQINFENLFSITEIGEYAFSGCSSLKQISIPFSVTEIGEYAFSECSSLTHVIIPSSVTKIWRRTFSECTSLTQVMIPPPITEMWRRTISECSSLTQIIIPSSVTEILNDAFSECSSLTQVINPLPMNEIGEYAFTKCLSLTQITIPSSVTKIWRSAFSECSSLTQITFENPSSLTEIGEYAFSGCSSLTQITIPSSVTKILNDTFSECSSLTQITFENPSSLTEIGEYAFSGCSSLTQITIPSSVTKIGKDICARCPLLTKTPALESQEKTAILISQANLTPSLNISFDQSQIIDNLISSQNANKLIKYLHNSCNNDTISAVYENCFKTSPNFYNSLIKEGININDAVSHHEYAINCIVESSKQEKQSKSNDKLNEAISHLKESIKNGYLFSYLLLSLIYHNLLDKNLSAFNAVKEGATQGEKYCKCLIGYFIAHGIGTTKDFMKGISIILSNKVTDFYEEFATDIGIYYTILAKEERDETNKISDTILNANRINAFEWFERAFNMNKTKATINNIGICYLKGYGVKQNIEKAKEIFQLGMNQNDTNSMCHIDFIYEEEDPIKSLYCHKQAADQNHFYSQLQNAFNKLQNDKEESLRYYKIVIKQGESSSQLSLAKLINKSDPDKSLALYKKAAEKGNIEAQEFLAIKFSKENDMENFDKYCKMLIKNGNSRVPLEFAVILYKSKKFKLSFYYFSFLCDINHPIARYFIGVMKFYGQGCVQDKNESFNILSELSKQGIEKAANFIDDHFN